MFVAAMINLIHKLYLRFGLYKIWSRLTDSERVHEKLVIAVPILVLLFYILRIIQEWAFVFVQTYNLRSLTGSLGAWAF